MIHCIIQIAIMAGGLPVLVEQPVNGKLLYEYMGYVEGDFSDGVKGLDLVGKASDYNDVIIRKDKCSIK
jgi:hypothetical protein